VVLEFLLIDRIYLVVEELNLFRKPVTEIARLLITAMQKRFTPCSTVRAAA
jgi:hypothetical protein